MAENTPKRIPSYRIYGFNISLGTSRLCLTLSKANSRHSLGCDDRPYISPLSLRRLSVGTSNMKQCSLPPYELHALGWALNLLLFFASLSNGAALQSRNTTTMSHYLHSLHLPFHATPGDHHCTRSDDWSAPNFDPRECEAAIDFFRRYEEELHGHQHYEYVFRGTVPAHPSLVSQMLPRQYKSSQ